MSVPCDGRLRPLVIFFAISGAAALVLALPSILAHYGVLAVAVPVVPLLILGSWTPNLAAVLVLWLVVRTPGEVGTLFRRWTVWRVAPVWYLAALSPFAVAAAATALYTLVEGRPAAPAEPMTAPMLAALLVLSLVTGAMGEEMGWRGFALPRLLWRTSALGASCLVGAAWGLWHLPLWFTGLGWDDLSFPLFAYNCIAVSIIMTWVYQHTGGNLLLITLLHMSYNVGWQIMVDIGGVPMASTLIYQAAILTAYALIVVLRAGPANLTRRPHVDVPALPAAP